MTRKTTDDLDSRFEKRASRLETAEDVKVTFYRFLRYLSTRKMECWGFFAAGFVIATIF